MCRVGGSKSLNHAEDIPTEGPTFIALPITDGGNISTTRKSRSSRIQSYPRLLVTEELCSSKVILLIFKISTLRVDQPNKRVPLLTGSTILEGARALFSCLAIVGLRSSFHFAIFISAHLVLPSGDTASFVIHPPNRRSQIINLAAYIHIYNNA